MFSLVVLLHHPHSLPDWERSRPWASEARPNHDAHTTNLQLWDNVFILVGCNPSFFFFAPSARWFTCIRLHVTEVMGSCANVHLRNSVIVEVTLLIFYFLSPAFPSLNMATAADHIIDHILRQNSKHLSTFSFTWRVQSSRRAMMTCVTARDKTNSLLQWKCHNCSVYCYHGNKNICLIQEAI